MKIKRNSCIRTKGRKWFGSCGRNICACSQNISRTAGFTTRLREHNIEPWIVSASAEEIVRMVASDPKYGLHIKPENVIGVNLLLSYEDGRVVSSAEEKKAEM